MQEPDDYLYEVFVSYRHRPDDERWARRLQEVLETFETPRELVADGVRARLGKVFVDDTEMAAGSELSRTIKTALWSSKWLIVVCSPDTPGSDWVRQEINLFRNAWGRRERTLALLTAGTPAQSYPPELRELRTVGTGLDTTTEVVEPAGADVTEVQGKTEAERTDLARDRLAATLLGCDLGALRNRQEERIRRETTSLFFHDMVRRRGVPEGVGEVTAADQRRREATLRFDRRGGLVRTIERINGSGFPVKTEDGICRWDVSWRADETIEAIDHRDRHGDTRLREQFNRDATVVDFFHDDQTARAQGGLAAVGFDFIFSDADRSALRQQKTRIVRQLLDYDERGFIRRIRYASDGFNTPAEDALGAYGELHECDAMGLPIMVSWLDARGGPFVLKNGTAHISRHYDLSGRKIRESYTDNNGILQIGRDWYASKILKYDEFGNIIEIFYFDLGGRLVLNKNGYASFHLDYDARGNFVEGTAFGTNNEIVFQKDGYARFTQSFDAAGNMVEGAVYGIDHEPTFCESGYSRVSQSFDARGNAIGAAYFGVDGRPVLMKDGYAFSRLIYDLHGSLVAAAFFDTDNHPTFHSSGFASFTRSLGPRGEVKEMELFGLDGEPILCAAGYSRFTVSYDARGNAAESAFFGIDGEPTILKDGYARIRKAYDSSGNCVEEAFFGVDGEPVLHKDGYARGILTYDPRNNFTGVAYFGVDDEPVRHKDGYARFTKTYDARGNAVESRLFGIDGLPVVALEGYSTIRIRWDHFGRRIERSYFGLHGEALNRVGGYHRVEFIRDRFGGVAEKRFFDVLGARVPPPVDDDEDPDPA